MPYTGQNIDHCKWKELLLVIIHWVVILSPGALFTLFCVENIPQCALLDVSFISSSQYTGRYVKGSSRKFNVISKRKFIAKGGGGVCGLIHTFWMGPTTLIFKILNVKKYPIFDNLKEGNSLIPSISVSFYKNFDPDIPALDDKYYFNEHSVSFLGGVGGLWKMITSFLLLTTLNLWDGP